MLSRCTFGTNSSLVSVCIGGLHQLYTQGHCNMSPFLFAKLLKICQVAWGLWGISIVQVQPGILYWLKSGLGPFQELGLIVFLEYSSSPKAQVRPGLAIWPFGQMPSGRGKWSFRNGRQSCRGGWRTCRCLEGRRYVFIENQNISFPLRFYRGRDNVLVFLL